MVNINIPAQDPFQGFYLAHQGSSIVDLNFQQVTPDTPDKKEGHFMETIGNEREAKTPNHASQAGVRTFRNFAGAVCWWVAGACALTHARLLSYGNTLVDCRHGHTLVDWQLGHRRVDCQALIDCQHGYTHVNCQCGHRPVDSQDGYRASEMHGTVL